jgi:hypothetical protein
MLTAPGLELQMGRPGVAPTHRAGPRPPYAPVDVSGGDGRLTAYVLVPEVGVFGDESAEHLDAFRVIQHHDLDSQVS